MKMLSRLAFRNVRRSLGDYAVYLITITLAFSLVFSFGLVASSKAVIELSSGMTSFRTLLDFVNAVIILVICFLVNYTTKFMFTKRSREFGMYLLLGIRRNQIVRMFLLEILLLGLIALTLSIPLGFIISQFLSMLIVNIFGVAEIILITLQAEALEQLIVYFSILYLLVFLNMLRRMGKMNIRRFLDMEEENEKKMLRSSGRRNLLFVLSFLLGAGAFVLWNSQLDLSTLSSGETLTWMMTAILLFIISIYGISVTGSDMLLTFVLNRKKMKYTGDHLFIARTFSSKVRSMSMTAGTLSVLVTLTLLALNFSYLSQGVYEYTLESEAPYDVSVHDTSEVLDDYIDIIAKDYTVKDVVKYNIYKEPKMTLNPIVSLPGSNEDFDSVISLGSYNALLKLRGMDPVTLKDTEYMIVCNPQYVERFENAAEIESLTLADGSTLRLSEITDQGYWLYMSGIANYAAIFPDQYTEGLEIAESNLVVDTVEETSAGLQKRIEDGMRWHLVHTDEDGKTVEEFYRFNVRGLVIEETNSMTAMISSLCLYIAFIFLSTVGTILAVQSLSDASKYRYRYTVLNRLGVSSGSLFRTIFRQLLILFVLPVIYPVIIVFLCMTSINRVYKLALYDPYIYLLYFLAGLGVFLLVYGIYFAAAFVGFKRNIQVQ